MGLLRSIREGRSKILGRTLDKGEIEKIINEDGLKILCEKSLKLSGEFRVNKCLFVRIRDTDSKAGVNNPQYLAEFLRDNFNGDSTFIEVYVDNKDIPYKGAVYLDFAETIGTGKVFRRATLRAECYVEELYKRCPSLKRN